jgi:alpha,alpha-trehalase
MFKEIQLSNIFADSKTFVDSLSKLPMADIANLYHAQKNQPDFDLHRFVHTYFELPPAVAADFKSDTSQSVEQHIHQLWDLLTRKPDVNGSQDAAHNPHAGGSLIALPNAYVVPGGRFREAYYWDSYFTMLGLKASNRWDLIEGMVNNFSFLIDTLGFIPNGNRSYYEGRSQPPFYALMVALLAQHKGVQIYPTYLPQLLKEYEFWMAGAATLDATNNACRRVVLMPDGSRLNRYWDDIAAPRPESFKEDYEMAERAGANRDGAGQEGTNQENAGQGGAGRNELYRHIRAAAESGWDFTSRWFKDAKNMHSIHTTDIVPVDLNCLLFNLETFIATIYTQQGDTQAAEHFTHLAAARKQALLNYCWNDSTGFFHDYDLVAQQQTGVFSLAALFPLYFQMAEQYQADRVAQKIAREFLQAGGLTTTLEVTGQQWDAPNGWAPLQWISIQGLRHYQHNQIAQEIKQRWVNLNIEVYKATGKLVEKYNVYDIHVPGGGGEYELQDGFGWTNGVLLHLLSEQ